MSIKFSSEVQHKVNVPFYINSEEKFQAYQDTLRRWSMVGGSLFFLAEIAIHEAYQKLEKQWIGGKKPIKNSSIKFYSNTETNRRRYLK